jgi:phosphonate transport system permease protein
MGRESVKFFFHFIQQFFPPDLSPHYLRAELPAVLQTVEIAASGTLLALIFGLIVGIWVGAKLPGGRLLYASLIAIRSIPDIVLALLCVVMFGVGTGPGTIAIALFYGAAIGKIYSDLLLATPRRPVEALQATGAGRIAVAFWGLLPLRSKDIVSYGAYEFESAVRAAVIVGAVGGGGLGVELIGTINEFDYHRTCTLILLLVLLVAALDVAAQQVKKRPLLLIAVLPLMAIALYFNRPGMLAFEHAVQTYKRMLPPAFSNEALGHLPGLIAQTLQICFGGMLLAVIAALPLSLLAARNLSPAYVSIPARRVLEGLRSVPEIVWGLVFITASVLGPPAGIAALALHCTGSLGRLFAESFENIAVEPVRSLAATGASRVSMALFAFLSMAAPTLAVHVLFRLEWSVRAAAVVGIIGAGGIGEALFHSMQLFFYREMMGYILVTGLLVAAVDLTSSRLRKALHLTEVYA